MSVPAITHQMIVALLCAVPLSVSAQLLQANRQQKFKHDVPAGHYSGLTPIGNDRYAVVSDKSDDGFFLFHITIDSLTGRITGIADEGFRRSGYGNRDQEGIAYNPSTRTLFISGEADNQVLEYTLDGKRTGRRLEVPAAFRQLRHNNGLEALCYDHQSHRYYTLSERPAVGDSLLRLTAFSDNGQQVDEYVYTLDSVPAKRHGRLLNGVSALCAIGNGRLLVLERTVRKPPLLLGAYVECRLYIVKVGSDSRRNEGDGRPPSRGRRLEKQLLYRFRTHLNLLRRNLANYEGLCVAHRHDDGRLTLLLVADSQQQYRHVLRDWWKTLIIK